MKGMISWAILAVAFVVLVVYPWMVGSTIILLAMAGV